MRHLITLTLFLITLNTFSQRDWKENTYYKFRGDEINICNTAFYPSYSLNNYGGQVITGYFQKCKVLKWVEEYHAGDISIWYKGKWEAEWADGSYWRCYWATFDIKLER